jgi:6-phosphogluconolactonase
MEESRLISIAKMPQIEILDSEELLAIRAAELFVETVSRATDASGKCSVALSGGSTPKALYEKLTKADLEWDKVDFYFGDERLVPPRHSDSNFRMANEILFTRIGISESRIHRWRTELDDPEQIANDYQDQLEHLGTPPRLDLTLLGIGDDCHTASLFPNTIALNETSRYAVSNWVPKLETHRLTVTFPLINNSANVLVLASGPKKAAAIQQALKGDHDPTRFPIQGVAPADGQEFWLLDKDAASRL